MLTIKAIHIISVIFWSAGLLYLPRLFVYHAECEDDVGRRRFCVMEKRLYWLIMTPAMCAALIFGVMLLQYYPGKWAIWKILTAFLIVVFHGYCGFCAHRFARDKTPHGGRFFRLFNEVPALLIVVAVLLAVLKPY